MSWLRRLLRRWLGVSDVVREFNADMFRSALDLPQPIEYTAPARLILEPNPVRRQFAVIADLQDLDRAQVERALELFHEYFLSEMAQSVGPVAPAEARAVYPAHEAPLIVLRRMALVVADVEKEKRRLEAVINHKEREKHGRPAYGG